MHSFLRLTILAFALAASHTAVAGTADDILDAAGVQGGLVVHLGCGDGKLTAALRANDRYLVHGLAVEAANVAKARQHIRSLGRYGPASVDTFDGRHLPYADDLVNLFVAEDLGDVPMTEAMRVLAPNGVALVGGVRGQESGVRGEKIEIGAASWTKIVKPCPKEIDQWTHFLHDASNNAVARDTVVGPPRRLKWKCGPLWSRSHEFISSISAMVSAGGRVFYVVDEGQTSLTDQPLPERWILTARDAFNGVLLWKRPLPQWRADAWKNTSLRGRPASVPRRIVGDGRRLYATLSHRGPLLVLDGATGKTLQTIAGTANTQEILLTGRMLVLRLHAGTAKRGGAIAAFNADTGDVRWRVRADRYTAASLASANGRIVFHDGAATVCLKLDDGSQLWRHPQGSAKGKRRPGEKTFILHEDLVLEGGNSGVTALSAKTGKVLWTAPGGGDSMRGHDLFVAQGCAWHSASGGIAGYDLATGKPVKVVDPSSVQSDGHHLRCYRAKATERFLITQFRGAEFVSLTGEDHANNDWIRGACRFGVVPCNGLLYVPPNPCFCYPGAKLTGLLALAPAGSTKDEVQRTKDEKCLVRGPAFGKIKLSPSSLVLRTCDDWPTYRHDGRRSGATACEVSSKASVRWQAALRGRLTPPVVAGDRVFVAAKDEHTLYAMHVDDGRTLWHFIAGGRIDSPPTIHGGSVLFGCADGAVYCLRASDGKLAWRFRAVPNQRRIVAFSQLESPWRVHGSVLVRDGVVYGTAGRSSFLDGGIRLFGLNPATGEVVCETLLDTRSPLRKDAVGKPFIPSYHMEGSHSDILVAEGPNIFLGQYVFDRKLVPQPAPYNMPDPQNKVVAMDITKEPYTVPDPNLLAGFESFRGFHRYMEKAHPELTARYEKKYGGMNMGDRHTGMHLSATAGFLDDTWFNRTYWMYSANWPGWYHAHRGAKSGQLLVVGPERTYALQAFPTRNRQSPLFTPGEKGYLLLADDNDTEPVLDDLTRGATKGLGYARLKPPVWYDFTPIRVRGMVLAGKHLFVAGPPDVVDADDPLKAFEGRKGGVLRVYSADKGKTIATHKLKSPPVFDGLIAATGRLFICTTDGHVVCMAGDDRSN